LDGSINSLILLFTKTRLIDLDLSRRLRINDTN